MNTPRDILLARHQAATPKLDALRLEVVAGLDRPGAQASSRWPFLVSWCLDGSRKLWQELYLPSRRIWSGLATIWILILIVNLAQRDGSAKVSAARSDAAGPTMSLQAQQRWLNELLADRATVPAADRPRNVAPKPRTEKTAAAAV